MDGSVHTAETMQLIKEVQNGDETKMETLVTQNEGLIRSVSRRFINRGTDPDDLFQIACIGFMKAVRNFDLRLGLCFSTYAVPTMCGEIKRYLRSDGILKVSRSIQELSGRIRYVQEAYRQQNERDPTVSELAEALEVQEEEIVLALDSQRPPESIYSVLSEESSSPVYLVDMLENQSEKENGDIESVLDRISLRDAVRELDKRERQLISLRYFREMTQSRTAQVMGISQVQVSRLEKKILCKMRAILAGG